MPFISPEIEYIENSNNTIRYLEHGWPSKLCRWHAHEEFELHLVTSSHGRCFIGDYIGEFQAGALFLTGPNVPHNWITDKSYRKKIPIRDMLLQFKFQNINHFLQAFPEFQEIRTTLNMARSGIEFIGYDEKLAHDFLVKVRDSNGPKRVFAFLSFLMSVHDHKDKKILSTSMISQPEDGSKYMRIANIIDYISKNFAEDISLTQAADMTGMSIASFARNFQKVTGKKFVEFVNRIRIGEACSLLYLSDKQISTICYDVGFQNLANFNRHFIKIKKMTPTAYRNLARHELSENKKIEHVS
ncbi:MAG: AraC family transcriptional regulator [Alphaproteobacteria bacterium]|nr:AraC family transcriptional regulator [Alphaproteobacteria bacterium]